MYGAMLLKVRKLGRQLDERKWFGIGKRLPEILTLMRIWSIDLVIILRNDTVE